jgi:5-methylcytosine-specific restriction endonuclease McrBC regulatory subunit McrC
VTRVVRLTERRTRTVRLPHGEVEFLLAHARNIIDITPTFAAHTFNLTPRGYVGFLASENTRYEIAPKLAWPHLQLLLGFHTTGIAQQPALPRDLLAVLATAFAEELEAVSRVGLVAGYGETESVSPFLRGRLRTAAQLRDAASRAFPDRFHIEEPVFDFNTVWNQIAKATATALLRHELPLALRQRIEAATAPLADVESRDITEHDFATANREPRVAHYAALLRVCEFVLRGFAVATPATPATGGSFLLDLSRVFERYVARELRRAFANHAQWEVQTQPAFAVGPTVLQPDIVIAKRGQPWAVLDTKWKRPASDASDIHQVLAYAALTGARRVALVYPGSHDGVSHAFTPNRDVRISRLRLRVAGTATELAASIAKLASRACRK